MWNMGGGGEGERERERERERESIQSQIGEGRKGRMLTMSS